MVMLDTIKRHKIISCLLLVNVIAIVVLVVAIIIHNAKTVTVDIYVVPSDAKIELNGRTYENFVSHDVFPGTYHVKISMDGMQTKEYDLELKEGDLGRIWTYLLDENGGFSYYLTHAGDESMLEEVATDEKALNFIAEYQRVASIEDELPIEYDAYTEGFANYIKFDIELDNREDCPKIRCLKIVDGTGGNEQTAKNLIRDYGYNPDDYEISYEVESIYSPRATYDEE